MRELAEAPDIQTFLELLQKTSYGEINVPDDDKIAINLERVFTQKFIERIESIVKITPTKMGEFLRSYFDLRFEVLNLKRILRGKFTDSSHEQIYDSLIPIDPFLVKSYSDLIESDNLEEAVLKLEGTPYTSLVSKMGLYKQLDALWPFELELNSIYAKRTLNLVKQLSKSDQHIVTSLVKFETDIENVLIAIKRRGKSNINLDENFPVTYRISLKQLEAIMNSDNLNQTIDELGEPYVTVLEPFKQGDIALVRAMLRKGKYMTATTARAGNEFGFNVILAYLVYSEIEKDNLVGLAWGEVQGLDPEQLMKYIVIPWD